MNTSYLQLALHIILKKIYISFFNNPIKLSDKTIHLFSFPTFFFLIHLYIFDSKLDIPVGS